MKVKKGKQFRKKLQWYKIHHKFHPPYKIVLDGNFLKACMDSKYDFQKKLEKTTGGKCWFSTTNCVIHELSQLGDQFRELFISARRFKREKCKHEKKNIEPSDCLKSLVADKNEDHYFLATQDSDLWKAVEQLGPIPIISFANGSLNLSGPTEKQLENIEKGEKKKFEVPEHEMKILKPAIKKMKVEEKKKMFEKLKKKRDKLCIKIKKKAKGPNPLSIKKKSSKA